MAHRIPALVVSSQPEERHALLQALSRFPLRTTSCSTLAEARACLTRSKFRVVICDDRLPDGSFRDILESLRHRQKTPLIVASKLGDWTEYLEALRLGVFDLVVYPYYPPEVERVLGIALREARRAGPSHAPRSAASSAA